MRKLLKIITFISITALWAVMLLSCGNPDALVRELALDDTISGIMADSIVFYRSDSGVVRVELHAPRLLKNNDEDETMEFPSGFQAFFYDRNGAATSEISAAYGKTSGSMIEAVGEVVVKNHGNEEKMCSDKLYWFQNSKMMYTRSHVRIVSPDKDIEGDSLVAKEDFSEYTIYNGRATLEVDEEL